MYTALRVSRYGYPSLKKFFVPNIAIVNNVTYIIGAFKSSTVTVCEKFPTVFITRNYIKIQIINK